MTWFVAYCASVIVGILVFVHVVHEVRRRRFERQLAALEHDMDALHERRLAVQREMRAALEEAQRAMERVAALKLTRSPSSSYREPPRCPCCKQPVPGAES